VKARPDHGMGIEIAMEQKMSLLNIELSKERIREAERRLARAGAPRQTRRVRPLRRLLTRR
jgi:hypothetical protein